MNRIKQHKTGMYIVRRGCNERLGVSLQPVAAGNPWPGRRISSNNVSGVAGRPAVTDIVDCVVVDHRIMGGVPCVRGTRIPVVTILGLLGEGLSPAEVIGDYPQLVLDDVLACLRYAARSLDA